MTVPVLLAVLAAGVLYFYLPVGRDTLLDAREPGAAATAPSTASVARAGPEYGKLIPGKGKPSDLPGSWPTFRGPDMDGVNKENVPLAASWPQGGPKKLWSVDLGEGYAGAAVRAGRVYVLDYDSRANGDALRCLSLADGSETWRYFYPVKIKVNHGISRTVPAVSEKYVVTLGPKCHVLCVDALSGQKKWSIDLAAQYGTKVPMWYAGQCPIIDGGKAIIAPGGPGKLMIAVDCETGKVVWTAPNPGKWEMTHSSVVPMTFEGRRMYVYCGSDGVAGVSADDGSILWLTNAFKIVTTVPTPLVLPGGRIFCSGGYNAGSAMFQLKAKDGKIAAELLFRLKPEVFGATQQTPVYYQGHIYGVRPNGELVCLDESGKVLWASVGETFNLGPLMVAGGMIYVMDDFGTLTLARADEKGYARLARARVLAGPEAWGPMAMAGGRLILRDMRKMVCLDVAEKR